MQVVQQLWGASQGDGSDLEGLLISRPALSGAKAPQLQAWARTRQQSQLQHSQPEHSAAAVQPGPQGVQEGAVSGGEDVRWHARGSGVGSQTLLGRQAGQQQLGLPYDFAWALLLERSVFDAPFPHAWLEEWLEGQIRSQQGEG